MEAHPPVTDGGDADTPQPNSGRRKLGAVDQSFYIIGVGASAGGLDAIKQLVAQAGTEFPHTFVIIQHISPDHKSLMSEILSRETSLPVHEVADDMEVKPGQIYLIPPMSNVVIQGTLDDNQQPSPADEGREPPKGLRFSLVAPSPRPRLNLPIDLFFHSLSEAVKDRAIAIVLSGTGTDGSRGLRTVKDRDGFVIVQEPETADFDGMPLAAIATKTIDLIAAPDAMISEIQRYITLREDGIQDVEALFRDGERQFKELLEAVSSEAGIDFLQYKEPTLKRRVARRMSLNRCETLEAYIAFAKGRRNEISVLHREFLVGVTNFFRDITAWTALEQRLEKIFREGDVTAPVKVWSIGCSTGEEAYTAAILLESYRRTHEIEREFRIFASDVNEDSIKSAKEGIFPASVVDEIPERFRHTDFLTFQGDTFRIGKAIRNRVIFNVHNVLEDPPYIRTDIVICRNLLIYLAPDMQKRVLSMFSFSLRRDGILFLGAAESVSEPFSQFQNEVQKARIYLKSRTRNQARTSMPLVRPSFYPLPRSRRLAARSGQRSSLGVDGVLRLVLADMSACLIIIDESGMILETFGNYNHFVSLPAEGFSANLLDLVENRLKSAISLLMRKAESEGSAHKLQTKCPVSDGVEVLDIFCNRISMDTHPNAYSVLLRESGKVVENFDDLRSVASFDPDEAGAGLASIAKLESEIEGLQEMLSVTTEDLSVSNEELQTANEELTVSNEELQASNEEMQSINEELHTVNAENGEKILELETAGADIENLLNTSELAVAFLDDSLAIRRFNETFTRYVALQPEDYGRPLASFSSSFTPESHLIFQRSIVEVHRKGTEVVHDLTLNDGSIAAARIRPFDVAPDEVNGVAVSILDITQSVLLRDEVQRQRDRFEGVLESEAAGYWDWDLVTNTEYLSPRFKSMFGYEDHEMASSPEAWQRIIHPDDLGKIMDSLDRHVKSNGRVPFNNEVRYYHKDGSVVWVLCSGRVVEWGESGQALRMIGAHFDITPLKLREERVYSEADEIRRFTFIAAHDLLQPVNTVDRSLAALLADIEGSLGDEQRALVDYLKQATGRMRNRIRGVLDYARFFDETLEFETADLSKIIEQCIEDLGSQIDEIGADISVKPLGKALGKPDLIAHVFQNILSNAMKYRKPGEPCIIKVESVPMEAGYIGVVIADNGMGIPEEYRDSVFKLFSRLHTESEYEGVGVGLALCEKLMKLHNGRIWVEDGIDGGCAFKCRFQAVDESDDA